MVGSPLRAYLWSVKASAETDRLIQAKIDRIHDARIKSAKTATERARQLEDDLARVALLTRSLAELCLKKGLFTRAELRAMLLAVDFADGTQDGGLEPSVLMPGEQKLADLEPYPRRRPAKGKRKKKRRK